MRRTLPTLSIFLIAAFISIVSAMPVFASLSAPLFGIRHAPDWFVIGALPGIFVFLEMSKTGPPPDPWFGVGVNWLFYVLVGLLIVKLVRVFRARRNDG